MALLVQKYGGSSVADAPKIMNVARRVAESAPGNQTIVVVSAMGKTTDGLLALARQISTTPDLREMDMLLSTGEQVTIALLALALQALGLKARSFTGPQVGMRTDHVHTQARITRIEADRVRRALDAGEIVVVASFQGLSDEDEITTLGRGGSDLTAVALAAALKADVCEIYTDVDGVYTADPNIVPDARKLARVAYDEMLELASLGAKVLQTRSVEFAKKYDVTVHVRSTFRPDPGTLVTKEEPGMEQALDTGVTHDRSQAKISILRVPDRPGIAARVFGAIATSNIVVDMIVQNISQDGFTDMSFTLPRGDDARAVAELIRVSLANVCGSDLHFWRGDAPLRLPEDGLIYGHEMTGRVARLGARGKTDSLGRPIKEGDRVAYTYFYPCGRCYACLANEPAACPAKIERPRGPSEFPHFHGAFAEYYYLRPRGALFLVPDALPDEMVAPVNCALSQVIFGLGRAGLAFGGSVVIQGAGGLGIQAAAVARDMGAATVIVVDQLPGRLELARAFGADHTINLKEIPDRKERVTLVRKWTGGGGADVACDFVGFPQVIPEGIEMLRSGGTYLEIGTISRGAKVELEPSVLVWGSKKIVGVIQYDPWVIPRALDFLVRNRGRFPFDRLLSHKYPLEQINQAFADSEWHHRETTTLTRAALVP